jgi:hypothetical protein
MRHGSSRLRRASLVVAAVGLGVFVAQVATWAAPGGTGHTVTMTEITHGSSMPVWKVQTRIAAHTGRPCSPKAIL